MRGFFTLLLSLCSLIVSATDYYISSSGNDSANGLSSSTPWKSISKVNSASAGFMPGDRILFNRGNTFVGTIRLSRSGASGNPITIGAYGTGANPIISGFASLSGWISYGGGIYYKAVSCETTPNIVTVNGVNTPIGRWPNTGFLSIDSHVSNTSITDSELPSSPNWTGAEVVIRKASQIWDRNKITNHSGTTLTYTSGSYYSAQNGYGYFIQNDIKTLDRQGEWFHNGSNFYMYFGTNSPENYTVKVGVVDQLIYLEGINYVTIEGISFEGANSYSIQIRNSGYITVQSCDFNFTGKTTIFGPWDGNSPYCKILNNTIRNSNSIGIKLVGDHTNATVSGNRIENSGLIIGMGESGDEKYNAINAIADNIVVSNNIIENTGYVGIHFGGNNAVISNNYINNFGLVKNDGGGIYTWIGTGTPNVGQKVTGNIIMNGIGFGEGTPKLQGHSLGIYLDERVRNVVVSNNTVANCCSSGLYLHNAHEIEIAGNSFFNNGGGRPDLGSQVLFVHDTHSPDDPIRNIKMNNNILFSKTSTQKVFAFSTADNDISQFGTADYNYYARPLDDNQVITTWAAGWNGTAVKRTLADWQSYSGQDKNSKKSPITLTDPSKIRFEYNASTSNKVVSLDGSYIDVKGTKYNGSITLAPYTSAVLMVDPNPSAPPAIPVFASSAVENTAPSVIEMTYSLSLANIVPAASSFSVQVNSSPRSVSSVSVSGTKVLLTLSSPVAYGNTVTVAYTKPSTNPLQTPAGGQAASLSAQNVTNRVAAPPAPAVPVYVSSEIKDGAPSVIEMTYNLSLANIVPAASAFTVQVNSTARGISSVSVSGTKVLLTLSSPVAYGNIVTVAYTKPSTNPLQTSAGGQAATIGAQSVTNRIAAPPAPAAPVFVSAVIENTAPSVIEITYSLALAGIVPAISAFTVQVNAAARSVSSVSVSGTKVLLTLSSPVAYGNTVTVAYTKPSTNPLQTTAGGQAASIGAQNVTNRVSQATTPPVVTPPPVVPNTPPVAVVNFPERTYTGFVGEINAGGSYDADKDKLTFSWKIPENIPVSSTTGELIQFLAPVIESIQTYEFILTVSDGKTTQSKSVPITIVPFEPELETAEVVSVTASNYYSTNHPYNAVDGNISTMWSSKGEDQSLILELKSPYIINHVKIAFQPGQKSESYFDIYGSNDGETWEPILVKAKSCAFSGGIHVFVFPLSKSVTEFRYLKFVGLGNSVDTWNYISEFRVFGYRHKNRADYEDLIVKLYPNPARELVNIRIDDDGFNPDFVRILTLDGKVIYSDIVDPLVRNFQIPVNFTHGVYIVQMGTGNITMFTQKLVVFR